MKIAQTFIGIVCSVSLALLAGSAWGATNTGGKPLCMTSSGSIIDTTATANPFPYGCSGTPTTLTVTMYKLGLCTSDPAPKDGTNVDPTYGTPLVLPNVALDYSSCTFAFDSAAGTSVNLSVGGSISLGTAPAFPIGSYAYGVMIVANATAVSTTQQFSTAVLGTGNVSGTFCSTNGGSTYLSTASAIDFSPEGMTPYLTKCGISAPPASPTTVTLDTFDNQAAPSLQPVVGTIAISPPGSTTGDLLYGFLRKLDNVTVPTGTAGASNATRFVGVYKFKTAVSVTSATTSFKVNTIVTGGTGFGGGGIGGSGCPGYNCYVSRILGGPFIAYITAN